LCGSDRATRAGELATTNRQNRHTGATVIGEVGGKRGDLTEFRRPAMLVGEGGKI
jgi:hypothetical protein